MGSRADAPYTLDVTVDGFGLLVLALFGNGRSVDELIYGKAGVAEWSGRAVILTPWLFPAPLTHNEPLPAPGIFIGEEV